MAENGSFSDFTGYTRAQVLVEGNGIVLKHNGNEISHLSKNLDYTIYGGASKTSAELVSDPVLLFNVFAKSDLHTIRVRSFKNYSETKTSKTSINFIYSHENDIQYKVVGAESILQKNHLLQAENEELTINGTNFIFVELKSLSQS